jgi:hypothetical protein
MPHKNTHIQFGKDLFSNSIYSSKICLIIYNFFYLISLGYAAPYPCHPLAPSMFPRPRGRRRRWSCHRVGPPVPVPGTRIIHDRDRGETDHHDSSACTVHTHAQTYAPMSRQHQLAGTSAGRTGRPAPHRCALGSSATGQTVASVHAAARPDERGGIGWAVGEARRPGHLDGDAAAQVAVRLVLARCAGGVVVFRPSGT